MLHLGILFSIVFSQIIPISPSWASSAHQEQNIELIQFIPSRPPENPTWNPIKIGDFESLGRFLDEQYVSSESDAILSRAYMAAQQDPTVRQTLAEADPLIFHGLFRDFLIKTLGRSTHDAAVFLEFRRSIRYKTWDEFVFGRMQNFILTCKNNPGESETIYCQKGLKKILGVLQPSPIQ